jgi:hypothetical protein
MGTNQDPMSTCHELSAQRDLFVGKGSTVTKIQGSSVNIVSCIVQFSSVARIIGRSHTTSTMHVILTPEQKGSLSLATQCRKPTDYMSCPSQMLQHAGELQAVHSRPSHG